jgi:hypothetical protein
MSDTMQESDLGGGGGIVSPVIAAVKARLNAPFVGPVDITHLFLLTGLTIVFIGIWLLILGHIRAAAASVV